MKVKIAFFLVCIVLVTLGVVVYKKNLSPASSNIIDQIEIADAQFPSFSLLYIANKEGFFKENGLNVHFKSFKIGKDALQNVIAGSSDLATVYEVPFVRSVFDGKDIQVISSLHKSTTSTALIGLKSHQVTTIADVRGKRIGVIKGTNAEFFLYVLLTSSGIQLSDVSIIYLPPEKIDAALLDGSVDGIVIFNPNLYRLKNKLKDDAQVIYSNLYKENSLLVGKSSTVKNRPETMIKVLRALSEAQVFALSHRDKAIDDVVASIPSATRPDINGVWSDYRLELQLDNVLLNTMNQEAQWLKKTGNYGDKEIPNFRPLIFTEYLRAVNPEFVTLY